MDIIVLAILVIGFIVGYRKGFIDGIFGLIGGILALLLALITYKPIAAAVIPVIGIDDAIYGYVSSVISSDEGQKPFTSILDEATGADVIVNQGTNDMAMTITNFITNMLTLGALFIIYTIIVIIVKNILNGIASLPILDAANSILGGVLGLVKYGLLVIIAFAIIYFAAMGGYLKGLTQMIDNSYLSKEIYNNNIIVKVLLKSNLLPQINTEESGNNTNEEENIERGNDIESNN